MTMLISMPGDIEMVGMLLLLATAAYFCFHLVKGYLSK